MESLPENTDARTQERAPLDRQLPAGANKVERIAEHTKSLVDDLKDWVELRLKLTQMEVEEKVEARINQAVIGLILGVLAFLAAVFGLTTLALALGAWLGHEAWGFLIVTLLLIIAAAAVRALQPRLVQLAHDRVTVDDSTLSSRTTSSTTSSR